jgi:hypothetical membrane protein
VKPLRRRARRERVDRVDSAPRLLLLPAFLAPLALVAGWNYAAAAQSGHYDSLHDTLSELAAIGSTHREVMTVAFVVLGISHVGTALLLRPAAQRGRVLQAVGGFATIAVALFPTSDESDGYAHATAAAIAFVSLALWPAFGARRDGPPVLRPTVMRAASVVLGLFVAWFVVALAVGNLVGLAERVAALGEALWPLVVAWLVREWGGGGGTPPPERPSDLPDPQDEQPRGDGGSTGGPPDGPTDGPAPVEPESEPARSTR